MMKKISIIYSAAIFLTLLFTGILSPVKLYAQQEQIQFSHLTSEDGLSLSVVNKIIQDRRGFMWFGTYNGLDRYDGYNFKIYLSENKNPSSISGNSISAMLEDKAGNIWVGTASGLNRYDWKTEKFYRYKHNPKNPHSLSNNTIYSVYQDKTGVLWVGTADGLNIYNPSTNNFTVIKKVIGDTTTLTHNGIVCISEDYTGKLWFGTWSGLNRLDDRKKFKFTEFWHQYYSTSLSNDEVTVLCSDGTYGMWVGTNGSGLDRYDYKTKTFIHYKSIPGDKYSLSNNFINVIYKDRLGNIWVGTRNGLNKFDRAKNRFIRIMNDPKRPMSINNNEILSIYEDITGMMWIGTSGGVNSFYQNSNNFTNFKNDPKSEYGLSGIPVTSISIGNNNNAWIGTRNGLDELNLLSDKITHYFHKDSDANSLSNNIIMSVYQGKNGNVWIGTNGSGLDKYNPTNKSFTHFTSVSEDTTTLSDNGITSICEDRKGNLWVGTWWGLNLFNRKTGKVKIFYPDPNNKNSLINGLVWVIYEDREGLIWIGTDGGLDCYNPAKNLFTSFVHDTSGSNNISGNRVISIYQSKDGIMWFGTTQGLNEYNKTKHTFKVYTQANGLAGKFISSIISDGKGNLWIGTEKGLSKFNRKTNSIINFSKREGLYGLEFYQNSVARTKDGKIFMGSDKGLTAFYPDRIRELRISALTVITDLKIFNESVPIRRSKSILSKSITASKEIIVPYNDNIITLDFALLDYYDVKKNIFMYKLSGLDNQWVHNGKDHSVTFINLSPGIYVLHVKGTTSSGTWSKNTASLKIIITPPFWQTWWFRVIAALSLAALIFLIFKFRLRSINLQNKKLETLVSKRTHELKAVNYKQKKLLELLTQSTQELKELNLNKDKIMSVLAHDLKSPFNGLLGFTELLANDIDQLNIEEIKQAGQKIHNSASNIFKLLNNLLEWSLVQSGKIKYTPSTENLFQIAEEILHLFQGNAGQKSIQLVNEIDPNITIWADRNMMDIIFRNLISNAIKFTEDNGEIKLFSKSINGLIEVTVKDSGIGISEEDQKKLFNLNTRVTTKGTNNEGGTGLGLNLCRELINKNGGNVKVESAPGNGTSIVFTVPRKTTTIS